ncbi:MAG: cardiolipin synthase [Roseburia sp.]
MRTEAKAAVKNSIGRLMFAALGFVIQVVWIIMLCLKLNDYSAAISLGSSVLALCVAFYIYGKDMNAGFKLPWIIAILAFPVLGLCLYFLFGRPGATKHMRQHFEKIDADLEGTLVQDENVLKNLEATDFAVANQARYLWKCAGYPVWQNTDVEFHKTAEEGLEAQKRELRKAKKFIFMEYHAIEESSAFLELKEILVQKAKEGVEVRVFYDDVGSFVFINKDFIKRMEAVGIQCRVFNPMHPFLNIFMNNRDHRKITVIDGKVGFTGGYNLAEEYFNRTHPYGYWKDTGIMLTGDAVRNLTVMFLEMWNAVRKTDMDYDKYLPKVEYTAKEQGFVQPYADSPLDHETTGENVYMNLIKNAKHEIFFTTPYLIITDEMSRELRMAARRGVDVRIVTPGIPDKKMVYQMTRSYYSELARNGVRIYEYTPGFIHAKQCVCDGESATVGTINMDYRSLYLHFENGVLMYHYDAVAEIRKDFEDIFAASTEVTEKYNGRKSVPARMGRGVLRLFSPLV